MMNNFFFPAKNIHQEKNRNLTNPPPQSKVFLKLIKNFKAKNKTQSDPKVI